MLHCDFQDVTTFHCMYVSVTVFNLVTFHSFDIRIEGGFPVDV